MKKHSNEKRFEDFFTEEKYVVLKNYLYNYLLRRHAINAVLSAGNLSLILEVGSGLSPIVTDTDRIVYSELSFRALQTMKGRNRCGSYVVADGTRLPFAPESFGHIVCSEVLEHVEDDEGAIREFARVMRQDGRVSVTVPHRKFYFAADDRYVRHFRRYEIEEMQRKLERAGLHAPTVRKVLGPFEKVTMFMTVMAFSLIQRLGPKKKGGRGSGAWIGWVAPPFKWINRLLVVVAWIDARIMPRALSTVVLFEIEKRDAS
jgi:SAM-dependent methyltransferase